MWQVIEIKSLTAYAEFFNTSSFIDFSWDDFAVKILFWKPLSYFYLFFICGFRP